MSSANRIDKVLHNAPMLRVRAISFQRGPIHEEIEETISFVVTVALA